MNYQPAAENVAGIRFCTNCNQNKKSLGGYWKIVLNGKNRRWICINCAEKRIGKSKEALQQSS